MRVMTNTCMVGEDARFNMEEMDSLVKATFLISKRIVQHFVISVNKSRLVFIRHWWCILDPYLFSRI